MAPEMLEDLCRKKSWKVLFDISSIYVVFLISLYCLAIYPSPLVWVIVVLVNGTCQIHLSNLGHHATHSELAESNLMNDQLGRFLIVGPLLIPFDSYKYAHMVHHEFFDTEQDAARQEYYSLNVPQRESSGKFLFWVISGFFGGMFWSVFKRYVIETLQGRLSSHFDKEKKQYKKKPVFGRRKILIIDIFAILISQFVIGALMFSATGHWWAYLVLWILPMFTVMAGIINLRACLEHADIESPPQRLLNFQPTFLERIFFSRFEFHSHGDHHLTWKLGIPYYRIKESTSYMKSRVDFAETRKVGSYLGRLHFLLTEMPTSTGSYSEP